MCKFYLPLLFILTSSVSAAQTNSLGEDITLYSMMSANTYLDDKQAYYDLTKLGWYKVSESSEPVNHTKNSYTPSCIGKIFSNLQFDIWEHESNAETVFAFKGTHEKIDWLTNVALGISVPYKSAKKRVSRYIKANPNRNVVVTGHSLGGGIALSVSLWLDVDAYVFNSSPRVFDGFPDHKSPAKRVAIYQFGEPLQQIRTKWPKFKSAVLQENIIETHFNFSGRSNHRIADMAEGLLDCSIKNGFFTKIDSNRLKTVTCN